jgi:hypothetical protein
VSPMVFPLFWEHSQGILKSPERRNARDEGVFLWGRVTVQHSRGHIMHMNSKIQLGNRLHLSVSGADLPTHSENVSAMWVPNKHGVMFEP